VALTESRVPAYLWPACLLVVQLAMQSQIGGVFKCLGLGLDVNQVCSNAFVLYYYINYGYHQASDLIRGNCVESLDLDDSPLAGSQLASLRIVRVSCVRSSHQLNFLTFMLSRLLCNRWLSSYLMSLPELTFCAQLSVNGNPTCAVLITESRDVKNIICGVYKYVCALALHRLLVS